MAHWMSGSVGGGTYRQGMAATHRYVALLVAVGALALPAGASAQTSCQAPPGTGAIDQYCETIPRAEGPGGAGNPGSTRAPQPLPPSTLRALRGGGEDARALADSLGKGGRKGGAAPALEAPSSDEPSSNPLPAIKASVGSGGGIGAGFVWILVGITLLMLALAWLRFRRGPASD